MNRTLTAAARAGTTPPDARALQQRWDSVTIARALLQTAAVSGLLTALAATNHR